jgi:hypothetical protein
MKRRIGHISRTSVVLALTMATVAFGYFLVTVLGTGEGHATLGKGGTEVTYPVKVSFAEGLVPGKSEPVAITLENTTGKATTVKAVKVTATTSVAGCEASWFTFSSSNQQWNEVLNGTKASTTAVPVPTGNTVFTTAIANVEMAFKEEAAVDQTKCESAELKLKVVATP